MFQFKKRLGEYLLSTYNEREGAFVFSVLILSKTSVVYTFSFVGGNVFSLWHQVEIHFCGGNLSVKQSN